MLGIRHNKRDMEGLLEEKLYEIGYDEEVVFKERVNRFTVRFRFNRGKSVRGSERQGNNTGQENEIYEDFAHLHDTGRLKELLVNGAKLFVRRADKKERKTKWDVIGVKTGDEVVLINTSFHRYIAESVFRNGKILPFSQPEYMKPEIRYGDSKIDFYIETGKDKIYVEVKGCTLVEENTAKFPGAPSVRAVKHLQELMKLKEEGFRAAVLILIFRNSEVFAPEHNIDRVFAETFYEAMEKGVEVYPVLLKYKEGSIYFEKNIEIMEKVF